MKNCVGKFLFLFKHVLNLFSVVALTFVMRSTPVHSEPAQLAASEYKSEISEPAKRRTNFSLTEFPSNYTIKDSRAVFEDSTGRSVFLTLNPKLQNDVEKMLRTYRPGYGAFVALDPHSGAILAAAGSSRFGIDGRTILGRATFPAASLFKVITAAAAVEKAMLGGTSLINYRGGTHTLSSSNYFPAKNLDRKQMTLADAMGKSCNPVFARVALNNLQPYLLKTYADRFGFNSSLECDFPIQQSRFSIGPTDYEFARTAAGFEGAKISPVHAAAIAAAIGNGGEILRPFIIDEVRGPAGNILFENHRTVVSRAVTEDTSYELKSMMLETTRTGTARRHFGKSDILRSLQVAGKTGTLKGDNPEGLYHWFIGVAPASKPEIAVASLVIDSGGTSLGASAMASKMLDNYFRSRSGLPMREYQDEPRTPVIRMAKLSKKRVYSFRNTSSKKTTKKGVKARRKV